MTKIYSFYHKAEGTGFVDDNEYIGFPAEGGWHVALKESPDPKHWAFYRDKDFEYHFWKPKMEDAQ